MASSLSSVLAAKLRAELPGTPMTIPGSNGAVVTFPAKHPEVGDVSVVDEGDELVLHLGKFTHIHFGCYENNLSDDDKVDRIAADVLQFMRKLLADEIEFFGAKRGGGFRERTATRRSLLSKFMFGGKTYVWSGPLQ